MLVDFDAIAETGYICVVGFILCEGTMKKLLFIILMMSASPAISADYLDTQYGPDGTEAHLLKASVSNNILTIAFMLENTSDISVKIRSLDIKEANYTTKDTKYPVLQDTNGQYLASTLTYEEGTVWGYIFAANPDTHILLEIDGGGKKVGWLKFEAPADSDWPIELSLPGISPFTISQPTN